jgi:hypothetical protein
VRNPGVVVARSDKYRNRSNSFELLPEEVAGIHSAAVLLVEVTGDSDQVDAMLCCKVQDMPQATSQFLAPSTGHARAHSRGSKRSIQM